MIATLSLCSPVSTLLANIGGSLLIPVAGWQVMFVIAGVGALVIWVLRKNMPELPRWLESQGRFDEAERILRLVEAEAYRDCRTIGASKPAIQPAAPSRILFSRSVIRLSYWPCC